MTRSIFKDKKYFDSYILSLEESESKANEAILIGDISSEKVERANLRKYHNQIQILVAKYSRGDNLSELKEFYPKIIKSIESSWSEKTVKFKMGKEQKIFDQLFLDHHSGLLRVLSIGVLLNIDNEYFQSILSVLKGLRINNRLFDLLIQSKIPEHQIADNSYCPTAFNKLEKLVFETELNDKTAYKHQSSWYNGLNDKYFIWKDGHISGWFFGYWNFELAAVLKIKNIDAKKCYSDIYFPTDMYLNNNEVYKYEIPDGYKLLFAIDKLIALCGGKRRSTNQILNGRKIILGRKKKSYPELEQIINEYITWVNGKYSYQLDKQELQVIEQEINKEFGDFKGGFE